MLEAHSAAEHLRAERNIVELKKGHFTLAALQKPPYHSAVIPSTSRHLCVGA
jgi:hypothetical protein